MSRIDIGSVFLWAGGNALEKTGQLIAPRGAAREGGEGQGYTMVRTTQGLRQGRDGVLRAVATNVPMVSWYCTGTNSQTPAYAVLETTRNVTNLFQYSERFDNIYWTKTNATVSTNAAVSPDGTTNADTLIEDSSVGVEHFLERQLTGLATNLRTFTFSVYAKRSGRNWVQLSVDNASTMSFYANYHIGTNTAVGTTGTTASGHFIRAWYEVVPATEGSVASPSPWVRLVLQGRLPAQSTYRVQVKLATADNTTGYTGDGSSGVLVWGAMANVHELSPYVESATNSATARGDNDQFSIPLEIDPINTTWYCRMTEIGLADGEDNARVFQWGGLAATPRLAIWRDATPGYEGYEGFVRRNGSDIQLTQFTMTDAFTGELEIALQIDAAGRTRLIWSENGAAQSSNAWELVGAPPWVRSSNHSPQLDIGHVDDFNHASTRIRDILVVRGNYSIEECRNFVDASA